MRFPLYVALRFLLEGRLQSLLILAGVTVGVAVIVFLSALIGGLQQSLIDRTLGSQAHVVVHPQEELPRKLRPPEEGAAVEVIVEKSVQRIDSIDAWRQVRNLALEQPGVTAASPVAAGAGFAQAGQASYAIALRGIEPDAFEQVVSLRDDIVAGDFEVGGGRAVIGTELARDLGLRAGDKLRITTGQGGQAVLTVAGIFDLGNEDVNRRWVLVALTQAQALLDLPGAITSLELEVADVFQAERIARELGAATGLDVRSWMATNGQLLTALRSQASSSTVIQVFVVVAVALGIASVLVVSVVQRSRQIGILKAMGASVGEVVQIFLIQGGLVALVGSIIGVVAGGGLALGFTHLVRTADGDPLFPIDFTWVLAVRTAVIATAVGVAAAVAPARRAARLDPARAIHGE